jgi:hypothetical protein
MGGLESDWAGIWSHGTVEKQWRVRELRDRDSLVPPIYLKIPLVIIIIAQ